MANQAFQAFNIGKDMSVTVELHNILGSVSPAASAAKGIVLDISDIGFLEEFDANPQHSTVEIKPISHGGQKRFRDKFEHWEGSFTVTRSGPASDLLIQVLQDALLASAGGAVYVTIIHTVYDPMGSPSGNMCYAFQNCTLTPSGGGKFSGDAPVNQSFSFKSPRRVILDASGAISNSAQADLLTHATLLS